MIDFYFFTHTIHDIHVMYTSTVAAQPVSDPILAALPVSLSDPILVVLPVGGPISAVLPRKLLCIFYLEHKTNDWVRSNPIFLSYRPTATFSGNYQETETSMVLAYNMP